MSIETTLKKLFQVILTEAANNPAFTRQLETILRQPNAETPVKRKRSGRRAPGVIDPFEEHNLGGADGLRSKLLALNLDQLRDIVAQHGMDSSKLAMKWKTSDRLVHLILNSVAERLSKGDAFRR